MFSKIRGFYPLTKSQNPLQNSFFALRWDLRWDLRRGCGWSSSKMSTSKILPPTFIGMMRRTKLKESAIYSDAKCPYVESSRYSDAECPNSKSSGYSDAESICKECRILRYRMWKCRECKILRCKVFRCREYMILRCRGNIMSRWRGRRRLISVDPLGGRWHKWIHGSTVQRIVGCFSVGYSDVECPDVESVGYLDA